MAGKKPIPYVLGVLIAMVTACHSVNGDNAVTPGTVYTLANPCQDITLRKGDTFGVSLDGNMTTGYAWQLVQQPAILRILQNGVRKSYQDAAPKQSVGTGETTTWSFMAVDRGETTLVFRYARPWEKAQPAAKEYRCTVRVTR